MLNLSFADDAGLRGMSELAGEIWREYYPGIITAEQTEYMISRFQTEEVMREQTLQKGYRYAYIMNDGQAIGYAAVCSGRKDRLFLSKFYLKKEFRGRGLGSAALAEIADYARSLEKHFIYLTVNKNNELGIRAYTRNGYSVIQSIVTDIGQGFVMDDYVMELVL